MLVIHQHNMSCGILASLSVPTTSSTKSVSCSSTSCQHFWLTFFSDCRELNQCKFIFLMLNTQWAWYGLKFIRDLFVSLCLSICPSVHMYILPSVYPSIRLTMYQHTCIPKKMVYDWLFLQSSWRVNAFEGAGKCSFQYDCFLMILIFLGLSKKYLRDCDSNWALKYSTMCFIDFSSRIQDSLKNISNTFYINGMHVLMVMGMLLDWTKFISNKNKCADLHWLSSIHSGREGDIDLISTEYYRNSQWWK